ncbi:MAG: hypothetical protein HOV77_24975 [Hamadaea sp.]|uniref:hypothetical protein n=1 Tax=Hamadaea sp. TaxID=2024425 RepID=UPI00182EC608|nr:hypothetical protein [Hamadaea sp.]NUT22439.1 hypothetical protein [Hamadaea sp.]
MVAKDPYITALHRLGHFAEAQDRAVELGEAAEVQAELLIDRFFWQGEEHDAAQYAVDALEPASTTGRYLTARHAYSRLLFDHDVRPDDQAVVRVGFEAAAADPQLAGWGEFYLGVFADNILEDPIAAKAHFDRAATHDDPLVKSYVVRHLSIHEPERAEEHLRHSLYLRATLGYRPQTAAAMLALADGLPEGAERDHLRAAALVTARELKLSWLLGALTEA